MRSRIRIRFKVIPIHPVLRLPIFLSRILIFLSRIQGQKISDPGSGSASKNLGIFNPKNCSKLSKNYLGYCSSQIPDFGSGFFPSRIPDQGVKSTWSRIRIRNTASPVRSTHPQPWFVHSLLSLVQEVIVPERRRDRVFTDFDLEYFWQWTDFTSYVECVMTIAALGETTYFITKISVLCIRLVDWGDPYTHTDPGKVNVAGVKKNCRRLIFWPLCWFATYRLYQVQPISPLYNVPS